MSSGVYFIQAGDDGPIKIGQSEDVERRLQQLQTANHCELKLLWVAKDEEECEVHEVLADCRIRGEWFEPEKTLEYIKGSTNETVIYLENQKIWLSVYEEVEGVTIFLGDTAVKYLPGVNKITIDPPKDFEIEVERPETICSYDWEAGRDDEYEVAAQCMESSYGGSRYRYITEYMTKYLKNVGGE